jgi:hypothetical protein
MRTLDAQLLPPANLMLFRVHFRKVVRALDIVVPFISFFKLKQLRANQSGLLSRSLLSKPEAGCHPHRSFYAIQQHYFIASAKSPRIQLLLR